MNEPTALSSPTTSDVSAPESDEITVEAIGARPQPARLRIDTLWKTFAPALRARVLPAPDTATPDEPRRCELIPLEIRPAETARAEPDTEATLATAPAPEQTTVDDASVAERSVTDVPARPAGHDRLPEITRLLLVASVTALGMSAAMLWLVSSGTIGTTVAADAASARQLFASGGGLHTLAPSQMPVPYVALAAFTQLLALVGVAAPVTVGAAAVTVVAVALGALASYRTVVAVADSRPGGTVAAATYVVGFIGLAALATPTGITPAAAVTAMFVVATVAGLSRWATTPKPYSGGELAVFVGLPAAAAMLSGFAGWVLAALAAVAVAVIAQRRWHIAAYSRHLVKSYVAVPVVTALLVAWFSYRSYGDPLAFMAGAGAGAESAGSTATTTTAPLASMSAELLVPVIWIAAAAFTGAIAWALSARVAARAIAPWLLVAVPALYTTAAVWTGRALLVDGMVVTAAGATPLAWVALPAVAMMLGLGAGTMHRHDDFAPTGDHDKATANLAEGTSTGAHDAPEAHGESDPSDARPAAPAFATTATSSA